MDIAMRIKEHYRAYKGVLPVFGEITHYSYDHIDGKHYTFTMEGELC